MTFKLIDSPSNSLGGKHGFMYAIEIPQQNSWMSDPGADIWRALMVTCQERLGKQYKVKSKRPGRDRKWFTEDRRTFYRFYFKSANTRMLVMLDM